MAFVHGMKRPIIIVAVLLLIVVLGYVFVWPHGGKYRRAVEAYKRDLIAKGEKLSPVELAPTGAREATRIEQLASLVVSRWMLTNPPSAMMIISPGVAETVHKNFPTNQLYNYADNTNRVAQMREIIGTEMITSQVDYSRGMSIALPRLAEMKGASQLAQETMMQALSRKDAAAAAAAAFAGVDLVRLYDDNPIVICDLVRIAMASIAANGTWEALQSGQLSEAQLAELQAKWEGMDMFARVEPSVRMNRALNVEALVEVRKLGLAALSQLTSGAPGLPGGNDWLDELAMRVKQYPRYGAWKSTWSYDEELYRLQAVEAVLQGAREAKTTGAFAPALKALDQKLGNLGQAHAAGTNYFLLFKDDDSALVSYLTKAASSETVRRLTVTAIALQRFQMAHHAYPASLDELVPAYLAQVTADFMDGKPLRYRLKSDGSFLLYSVGEDGVDDGGDATLVGNNAVRSWTKGRDIVWPRAATAQEVQQYEAKSKRPVRSVNR